MGIALEAKLRDGGGAKCLEEGMVCGHKAGYVVVTCSYPWGKRWREERGELDTGGRGAGEAKNLGEGRRGSEHFVFKS